MSREALQPPIETMDESKRSSCVLDGRCGCSSSAARDLGCTLDDDSLGARVAAFRDLFARGLLRRESAPGRAEWIFAWSPELEAEARALAIAERACCSFFTFEITRDSDMLRWIATAPPERRDTLALLDEAAAASLPRG
jgi:hypothetical protein